MWVRWGISTYCWHAPPKKINKIKWKCERVLNRRGEICTCVCVRTYTHIYAYFKGRLIWWYYREWLNRRETGDQGEGLGPEWREKKKCEQCEKVWWQAGWGQKTGRRRALSTKALNLGAGKDIYRNMICVINLSSGCVINLSSSWSPSRLSLADPCTAAAGCPGLGDVLSYLWAVHYGGRRWEVSVIHPPSVWHVFWVVGNWLPCTSSFAHLPPSWLTLEVKGSSYGKYK